MKKNLIILPCLLAGVMLGTSGCDTPGQTGMAVGGLAALVGGGMGANLATAAVTGVAAGTTAAVLHHEYLASQAQKNAALKAAQEQFAAMSEEKKTEVKEKAGGRILVPVTPGPEAAPGVNYLAVNVQTGQVDDTVHVPENTPASGLTSVAGDIAYMP